MSELKDFTAVLRAIHHSLTSIEKCVASHESSADKMRESLHELKNKLVTVFADRESDDEALRKFDAWMGTFDRRLESLASDITTGFRADRAELTRLRQQLANEVKEANG